MFICEAADELFHWDDFALDLYSAERDEVVSLLNPSPPVEGQRVEIPASPQPKTANALVQRVISRGAELVAAQETGDQEGHDHAGAHPQGRPRDRACCSSNGGSRTVMRRATWKVLQTLADQCGGALATRASGGGVAPKPAPVSRSV